MKKLIANQKKKKSYKVKDYRNNKKRWIIIIFSFDVFEYKTFIYIFNIENTKKKKEKNFWNCYGCKRWSFMVNEGIPDNKSYGSLSTGSWLVSASSVQSFPTKYTKLIRSLMKMTIYVYWLI